MFSFANPEYFFLLLLLPAVALLYLLARLARRRNLRIYGKSEVIARLMPEVSTKRRALKLIIELVLLLLIVVMLARPRLGTRKVLQKSQGIEVVLAIDVSNSMDASSTSNPSDISRLQQAKFLLEKLIDRLDGNKVGLVVFAGNAYMQSPMTIDVQSTNMFLNDINTGMVSTQGTAIGAAINMAHDMFSKKGKARKAIVVITDGENQEDDAAGAAKAAESDDIQVDVVGVGSTDGAYIITRDGYRLTDDNGNEVVTRLNEDMANEIAKAGDGIYVNGRDPSALDAIDDALSKLASTSLGQYTFSRADEQFPIVAWIAIVVLIAWIMVRMKRNTWLSRQFKWLSVMLLLLTVSATSCSGDKGVTTAEQALQHEFDSIMQHDSNKEERNHIARGNKLYADSNYVDAEVEYRKAIEANEKSLVARYNLATAFIRQGIATQDTKLLADADSLLRLVIDNANAGDYEHNRLFKNHVFHNIGNIFYGAEQWDGAVEFFKQALRYNPDDNEARYNLRIAQLKLQNQQRQQQNQQNQQNQDQNQEQKDQNGGDGGDKDDQNKDDSQNSKNNQDQKQQTEQQQQAAQRHPDNNDAKRDERVMNGAKLQPAKPQEKKQDQKPQNDKQDQNKNKNDQNKDNNENNQPQQGQNGEQGNINSQNAMQILNTMQQREKETGKKVQMREEAIKSGERRRTQNKW